MIKSLSSIAEGEDEEAVVLEEQYPFGDAPTDEEVYSILFQCSVLINSVYQELCTNSLYVNWFS